MDKLEQEIIAEFMGVVEQQDFYESYGQPEPYWFTENDFYRSYARTTPGLSFNDFVENSKYHTSWEWIMQVVEKLSEFGVWTLRPGFAGFENYQGELREDRKFRFYKHTGDFESENDDIPWVFIVAAVCLEAIKMINSSKQ